MDLSQNTFFRMLHYRNSYKPELSFKSWLFGIARNVFLDNVKDKHSKTDSIENIKHKHQTENNEALGKFENEALHQALNKLSSEEREIIVMSRFQDMKYNEIAEIQGLSLSAVKVKVHRAIKKLREHYFKDDVTIDIRSN
ncbi:MAG: RNA polymerase sigma factor [Chloroflexia bacterium]|nr:RNA polymerase sigma factor [Chloroflexia bacterium]